MTYQSNRLTQGKRAFNKTRLFSTHYFIMCVGGQGTRIIFRPTRVPISSLRLIDRLVFGDGAVHNGPQWPSLVKVLTAQTLNFRPI